MIASSWALAALGMHGNRMTTVQLYLGQISSNFIDRNTVYLGIDRINYADRSPLAPVHMYRFANPVNQWKK